MLQGAKTRLFRWRATGALVVPLADQGLSSLSNFILLAAVALNGDAPAIAAFGIAYAVYTLVVGVARSYFGTAALLTMNVERQLGPTLRRIFLIGSSLALPLAFASAFLDNQALGMALVFAALLPFALVQDFLRHAAISSGRPAAALGGDLLWVIVAGACLIVPAANPAISGLIWGVGCLVSIPVIWCLLARGASEDSSGSDVPSELQTAQSMPMSVRSILDSVTVLLMLKTTLMLGGSSAAAGVQVFFTLASPYSVLLGGVLLALTPRIRSAAPARVLAVCGMTLLLTSLSAALWVWILGQGAGPFGELLVGDQWYLWASMGLVLWVKLASIAFDVSAVLGLRVLGARSAIALGPSVMLVVFVSLSALAWAQGRPFTAAQALVLASVGQIVGAVISWTVLIRLARVQRNRQASQLSAASAAKLQATTPHSP